MENKTVYKTYKIPTLQGQINCIEVPSLHKNNYPIVICLHGEGKNASCKVWEPIMSPLSQSGFRVISIDMPG